MVAPSAEPASSLEEGEIPSTPVVAVERDPGSLDEDAESSSESLDAMSIAPT